MLLSITSARKSAGRDAPGWPAPVGTGRQSSRTGRVWPRRRRRGRRSKSRGPRVDVSPTVGVAEGAGAELQAAPRRRPASRKPAPPAPPPAGNVRISGPVEARAGLGAADGGRSMTATWADVERAVARRPGRGPGNGRVRLYHTEALVSLPGSTPSRIIRATMSRPSRATH